ncbi:MAG: hypothetical protein KDD44_14995, partial [Bdellovibrionales bacterium]|nr:hypothetical protein [Bdellovibrionales bacterium]
MKTTTLTHTLSLFTLLFISATIAFAEAPTPKEQVGAAVNVPTPPPDTSSAELNRIKALAGKWKTTTSMFGKENEEVFTEYKVTAGGSAVVETIFPGTPNEMVSVYYDDDAGKLAMTHYCMMRNRPQFSLVDSSNDT